MKRTLLFATLAGGLALTGVTCAPQDNSSPRPAPGPVLAVPAPAVNKVLVAHVPEMLKPRLDAALDEVHGRDLRTSNGFWTIFHGILGMGPSTTLLDESTGKRVNALDEVCRGRTLRGLEFRPMPPHGVDVVSMAGGMGVGQGHQDQFIAEMTQWGMPRDRKFSIDGIDYTFDDFIRYSKMRASLTQKQELSWAIIMIAEFYGTDHKWTNKFGEPISMDDVVRYELNEPIDTAACGGTHRLFGLTWALFRHLEKGGKKEGVWKDAEDRIELYKQNALKFQNDDGSFSMHYVSKPGKAAGLAERIGSSGHVLEWLALAMTDDELRSEKVQAGVSALCAMILENASNPLDSGSLYHATHGLHLYRTRVFGTKPPPGLVIPRPDRGMRF